MSARALMLSAVITAAGLPLSSAVAQDRIGQAELTRARELLSQAHTQLTPEHWTLLNDKLAEAEKACKRFTTLAAAEGTAAFVVSARGAGMAASAMTVVEGAGSLARVAAASQALSILVLLWPSSTASAKDDQISPKLRARLEFEAKLRELARAAEKIESDLKAQEAAAATKADRSCSCRCFKKGVGPLPAPRQPNPESCWRYCLAEGYTGYQCGGEVIWP